ncbi:MAG: TIGR03790 family protein [Verrucomicrobiota bacterium]
MRCAAAIAFSIFSCANLLAGGSGLNVVVIVNQNSTNSLQLGNYYCEKRGVPPQNVLRINWTGGNVVWTKTDFETLLRAPLNSMLSSRQLSNQIDYVLLSMDIPYRVTNNTGTVNNNVNATTAALHYGFKDNPADPMLYCSLAEGSASAYAGSEGIFRQTPPISATSNSWLVMMLTSSNLAQAKAVVDRGVANDYSTPTQTVMLAKSPTDRLRRVRLYVFDDAVFNVRLRGNATIARTNAASPLGMGTLLGYEGGDQVVSLAGGIFAPGAMADNLTSFSGYLFENSGHTDALDFLNSGATASYGTIIEPCAYLAKFPNAQNFFYQARGFSIAECYYMSVTNPYQGVLIGEPLATPFAAPAGGAWSVPPADAILAGTTNLTVQFDAANPEQPLQQVDLFLDGTYTQTLTNIAPRQNNLLYVTINGFQTNYTIPAGATLKSVTSNLVTRLNRTSYTNQTKVEATAYGDRIGLQSLDITRLGTNTTLQVSNSQGSAASLTTFIQPARSNFLDKVAFGMRGYLITNSLVTVPAGNYLRCVLIKTNNAVVTVAVTNSTGGAAFNDFAKSFFDAITNNAAMQAADGIVIEDINMHEDEPYRTWVYGPNDHSGEFNIRAQNPGWPESQVRVAISGSPAFTILDPGTNRLDENVSDLQPRNHIYITAGVTNLSPTFPFNTTTQADGYHELTAVAYEGSHVRTQKRVSQSVRLQNTPLSATFTCLLCDTNTALEATLQFLVAANTNTVTRIELFSTGGSWGVVSNQPSATFSLAATNLGLGLHPFYALVMRNDGKQYRTETKWIRLIGNEPPFVLGITNDAPTVSWPATAGRRYEILSATDVTNTFLLRDAVTPTNSPGQWSETNNSSPQRFYRVRTAP